MVTDNGGCVCLDLVGGVFGGIGLVRIFKHAHIVVTITKTDDAAYTQLGA